MRKMAEMKIYENNENGFPIYENNENGCII